MLLYTYISTINYLSHREDEEGDAVLLLRGPERGGEEVRPPQDLT